MKNSAHSVHPAVAEKLAALDKVLEEIYLSGDFGYTLSVEGQIVATKNTHDDIRPAVWADDDVEAEVAKRAKKPAAVEPPPSG